MNLMLIYDSLCIHMSSAVAWQLTLNNPDGQEVKSEKHHQGINLLERDLCVLIFRSLISSEKAVNIHFTTALVWLVSFVMFSAYSFDF